MTKYITLQKIILLIKTEFTICSSEYLLFWHLSICICTFHLRTLEKDSIGVYNQDGGGQMEIQIIENIKERVQVVIKCRQMDNEIIRLKNHIEMFDKKLQAKKDNEWCFVRLLDVLYFESVNNRIFLYTKEDVMEVKQRLYELEMILSDRDFIRISKSVIININKIKSLKPEINRTILATMYNGEQLFVSRKYVPAIRSLLSI